jgi:glutamate N-acetyltransferase / amino-acid N-acetyltransferase
MKPKLTQAEAADTATTTRTPHVQFKLLHEANLFDVPGFRAAGVYAGLKKRRRDVTLVVSERPAAAAGVFTQNAVVAAPVLLTRETVARGVARAIVCNSGCANACTGEKGLQDARRMAEITAEAVGCSPDEVLVASTGVIGHLLPMEKVEKGIREAANLLPTNEPGAAAEGIMTTDTVPKQIVIEATSRGHAFRIGGIAKGSGMIAPNMATMLGFLVTDLHVEPAMLQKLLKKSVDASFNSVSVDHDTSTNDMVLLLANGASGLVVGRDVPVAAFQAALDRVTIHLAKTIARDGEGATKLLQVSVQGARSPKDAHKAAMAVVNSSLVKSAVHGADPNWGRILAAVGYSGAKVQLENVNVRLGNPKAMFHVLSNGEPLQFDRSAANMALKAEEVHIVVDLGLGHGSATAYGCDLSREYVDINAHYTT